VGPHGGSHHGRAQGGDDLRQDTRGGGGAGGGGSTAANGASAKSVVAKARMGRTGGTAAIVAVGAGVGSTHGLAEGTGMGGVPFRWAPPITHYYKIRRLLKTTSHQGSNPVFFATWLQSCYRLAACILTF
jgi:hypothetical protein